MMFGKGNNGRLIPLLLIILGAAVALVVGGYLISLWESSMFTYQASAEAKQVDDLMTLMMFIGGVIFLLVEGLLVYSVIRFRKPEEDETDGPTIHGNVTLEVIWTVIPAIIVVVLVLYSYQVWTDIREPKEDELTVDVTGARFAWSFAYEDSRTDQPIYSTALHTYAGQPMRLYLHTEDVIHSFWIPEMRVKQDVMPGRTTELRFTPIWVPEAVKEDAETGMQYNEYRVVCAELCGGDHGRMFTHVVVHESEEDYLNYFLDPAVETLLNPPEDPVLRGAQVLTSGAYPCSGCHTLEAEVDGFVIEWAGTTGPALAGVGDRAATRRSGMTAEEYLFETIYEPLAYLVPGYPNAIMPQFQAADADGASYMPIDDARAVIAFLCTQTSTGESACDLANLDSLIEAAGN